MQSQALSRLWWMRESQLFCALQTGEHMLSCPFQALSVSLTSANITVTMQKP